MIKKIFGSLAVTSLFAAPLLVACGSSGISSGVDGSKKGSELTTEEVQDVCNAVLDYTNDKAESVTQADGCKGAGYGAAKQMAKANAAATDAELQQLCSGIVDLCNSLEPETDDGAAGGAPSVDNPCDSLTTAVVSQCTATVADIESCSTERADAGADAFKGAPACSSVTRASIEADVEPEKSAACKSVDENCTVLNQLPGGGGGDDNGAGGSQ